MQRVIDGLWDILEGVPTTDAALALSIIVFYSLVMFFWGRRSGGGGTKRKDIEAIIREAVEGQVDAHFQFDKIRDICDRMADDAHQVKHIADQAALEAYEDALDILQQEHVADAVNENRQGDHVRHQNMQVQKENVRLRRQNVHLQRD